MELITAVIQPFMLDRVTRLLRKQKLSGYTLWQVSGSGNGAELTPDHSSPRIMIQIVVAEESCDAICDLILKTVSTHQEGDGILFVSPVRRVLNLKTGASGKEALAREE